MWKSCQARVLRLRYGVTLAELAQAAGVSRQLLSAIELEPARQTPYHEALLRLAFRRVTARRRERAQALERALDRCPCMFAPAEEEDEHGI